MTSADIYRDISSRTGGDIYIGVVGPVRSGKSTFIKKFMETSVLPRIEDPYEKQRAIDEMPQSASGRTVMTTEPKFIPDEAVSITLGESTKLRVKMVDCVGYIVPEALGQVEDGHPRMVHTPWSDTPLPFREAAELGTRKVIREHSTIGMLVTTDGTIGEIPRENYVEAEERVAAELSAMNKPYAIILNSAHPESRSSIDLAYELEKKYNAPVALVNCLQLTSEDVTQIMELLLEEFPVTEIKMHLPGWTDVLPQNHPIRQSLIEAIGDAADHITKVGDINRYFEMPIDNEYIESWSIRSFDAGRGTAETDIFMKPDLYYTVMSELTGIEIKDEASLIRMMQELVQTKKAYEKVASALQEVNEKGYGIVMPDIDELRLQEPQIVKKAGGYGVKLRASAQSIHMIKAEIETEINPIVGTEQQSEELIRYMLHEFEEDPRRIWESNMFGKSLYELINEGIHTKLAHMPEESRAKLSETLERIINEGSGGLICILL